MTWLRGYQTSGENYCLKFKTEVKVKEINSYERYVITGICSQQL